MDPLAPLRSSNRVVTRDPFPKVNAPLHVGFLVATIFRNDEMNGLAENLVGAVPEHPFGGVIPGGQNLIEIFAVDGHVGRVDDRRQVRRLVKAFLGH